MNALEQQFCRASTVRKARLTRRLWCVTAAVIVALTVAGLAFYLQRNEARRQTELAQVEAATALARLGEATATDDMRAALAAAASGYATVRNDVTEGTLLKLLLETRSLAWSVHTGDQVVTIAVPAGELAIYGTEDGAVSIVTPDARIEEVIEARGSRVVDITADAVEPVVAIAWQDGHVVLLDTTNRDVVLRRDWDGTPNAAAPYLDGGRQVVVADEEQFVVLDSAGERSVPGGAWERVRLRVRDGRATTGAFAASETDLATGDSFSIETGGNRAGVWDAAAGVAIVLDDRTTSVSLYPFAADSDVLFASDLSQVFDRELVPVDDLSLSGDGSRVAVLSGSVLEVWSIGPDFDGYAAPQRVDLAEGVARDDAGPMRVELDDAGQTAITSGGSTIQRWSVGRGVVAPELSPGGAMDGYIGIHVGDDEVVWDAYDNFDFRPARLDLVSSSWEFLDGGAAVLLEPVESDRAERVSPDGKIAGRISGGVVTLVRLPERTVLTRLQAEADEGYLTFTEDGDHLIVASRGGGLQVWPLDLQRLCPELDRRGRHGHGQRNVRRLTTMECCDVVGQNPDRRSGTGTDRRFRPVSFRRQAVGALVRRIKPAAVHCTAGGAAERVPPTARVGPPPNSPSSRRYFRSTSASVVPIATNRSMHRSLPSGTEL